MVTPGMIIEIIDEYFPAVKGPSNPSIPVDSWHSVLYYLSELLEKIPAELLPNNPKFRRDLELCKFAINASLDKWKNGDKIALLTTIPQGGYVVPCIRSILEKCPDEIFSDENKELSFILDDEMRESIRGDIKEIENGFKTESWKTVIVFSGSAMEAILYYSLQQDIIPKIKKLNIDKQKLEKGFLPELIGWAIEVGILEENKEKNDKAIAFICKNFRNLIHKGKEIRLKEKPSEYMAYLSIGAVKMVVTRVEEFLRKNNSQDVKAIDIQDSI